MFIYLLIDLHMDGMLFVILVYVRNINNVIWYKLFTRPFNRKKWIAVREIISPILFSMSQWCIPNKVSVYALHSVVYRSIHYLFVGFIIGQLKIHHFYWRNLSKYRKYSFWICLTAQAMLWKLLSHFPYNWPSQFGPFLKKKLPVCFYDDNMYLYCVYQNCVSNITYVFPCTQNMFILHLINGCVESSTCTFKYQIKHNNFSEVDLFHIIDMHYEIWNINKYLIEYV
jgi:hypothetical protein